MTLHFKRKYSTQGSGAPCHVSFSFFSGFYGIILAKFQIDLSLNLRFDLRLKGYIPYGMRFAFSIWFLLQDKASTIEDLREKNSKRLGNYSRRLQDYSRIS
jgi:hypothetical protein